MARAMELAGYGNLRSEWFECPTDLTVAENLVMFYVEVREILSTLDILTSAEVDDQLRLLRALSAGPHPAAWGAHLVVAEV